VTSGRRKRKTGPRRVAGRAVQAAAFLRKPIDRDALLAAVEAALARA
jgi:DNA-binding response OmpR family regulator